MINAFTKWKQLKKRDSKAWRKVSRGSRAVKGAGLKKFFLFWKKGKKENKEMEKMFELSCGLVPSSVQIASPAWIKKVMQQKSGRNNKNEK